MHTERRVFIRKEARTCLNSCVPHIPLFFVYVSTPTLKTCHKSMIVSTHRGAHEIKLCQSNGISIYNQVSLGSRWFLGSLEFLTNKFGNLSLQELELSKVARSGTDILPPAPVRVGLINKAQLRYGLGSLGETDAHPVVDKANHT
jgi:hypothetical protein